MVKPVREWLEELRGLKPPAELALAEGRGGEPTLKVGKVYLHSRYNPEQEAQRLVASAELDPDRPVLVVGLGLGYHVRALLEAGFEVAVAEPEPAVARFAVDGPGLPDNLPLGLGSAEELAEAPMFQEFAARLPQVLAHPATARLHPEYAASVEAALGAAALRGQHLNIAVVGPMYGGSLPITGYLASAFRKLGHRALEVDNSVGWPVYERISQGVDDPKACAQLTAMATRLMAEWTYARVAEFDPEICIVLAQAPVGPEFPARLRKRGIVTAFWYVENWRHLAYWKEIAPGYDSFFHIQPGEFDEKLEEAGCAHHAFVQTGCDPDVHRPVSLSEEERAAYRCDLSFAGAGYYNRHQVFKGLTDYDFKLWGVEWSTRELSRHVAGGERRFDSQEFMKIVAGTKVNLNLHSSTTHEGIDPDCDAINPRVFEIAAAGGFQVCDPCIGLDRHFDFETELPVYRTLKELRERIDYYLAHPEEREAVAQRARERALAEHTYEHRAQQMLRLIFERHGVRILKRGIRVQRTVGEMAGRVGADTELGRWLASLPPEVPFTQETLTPFVRTGTDDASYPERLFTYMREVREFAESLLKTPR